MSHWPKTGCLTFAATAQTRAWAERVGQAAQDMLKDQAMREKNLRHGQTWFVGVDALGNDTEGSFAGIPLHAPWEPHLPARLPLHPAQLSMILPGYPRQDSGQSHANHEYRVKRFAAHMDGLLPEGSPPRRFAREYHAYILGIHITDVAAAPTVYWPGSHVILQQVLASVLSDNTPDPDVTEVYHTARRKCFDTIEPVPLTGNIGGAFLLHPFALHGTAPWSGTETQVRVSAFFRPQFSNITEWLTV